MSSPDPRDDLVAILARGRCLICGSPLVVDRPPYGWGSMGGGVKCPSCGLRLRAAWMPLKKAIVKVAGRRRLARVGG